MVSGYRYIVTMTCLNGYFHDAALESLAEALLNTEHGGAVAVWAPSGMTGPDNQAIMNQELYRGLFPEGDPNAEPLTFGRGHHARQGSESVTTIYGVPGFCWVTQPCNSAFR